MGARPIAYADIPSSRHTAPPLLDVLRQCENLQTLVDAAARGQGAANADPTQNLTREEPAETDSCHAEVGGQAQFEMREISTTVSSIVRALHREVRHRGLVDHQLAAAVEQQEASHHASLHDVLTGMPNRALFYDRLEHGLAQALRHSWNLAVMFIDLDNFKNINDAHGHAAGDAVLRTIAGRLRDNTRIDDTVSRHGGDEFTYLALEIGNNASVSCVADRLIDAIGKPCNLNLAGLQLNLQVRASIGISIFPDHGNDAETLLRRADSAMYGAKKQGSGFAFVL